MKRTLPVGLFLLWACEPLDPELSTESHAIVPAGSNAFFVSHTIPSQMSPGERLRAQVTVRNTGVSTGGSNVDWSAPSSVLYRKVGSFGWTYTVVPGPSLPAAPVLARPATRPRSTSSSSHLLQRPRRPSARR